ncbi:MAG: hypothetical protein ABI417_04315 [Coleofasciculaceae cyanobacterium]
MVNSPRTSSTNNSVGKGGASTSINSRSSQQLIKASLISKIDPVNPIQFMFNPTDLQFSRTIDIQTQKGAVTSKGLPKVVFGHVAPYELNLSGLVFDTFEKGTTVIKEIQPLLDAVDFSKFPSASKKRQRPPVYYFTWGQQNYVQCMVKSLSCKLTMFLSDGTPVRAIVDLGLQQVDLGATSTILS